MNRTWIAYAALGLSVLACVLAVLASISAPSPSIAATVAPDDARVAKLLDEVAQLRADLARLQSEVRDVPAPQVATDRAAVQPAETPELSNRLAALEAAVAALRQELQDRAAAAKRPAATPNLADARRTATDPRASEKDRLAALQALRGQKIDGQDACTSDVVLSMLDLAERSLDENTRNDVYRNLHGATDSALRDSMLRALASDPSAKVRERAARDIDTFLADALVQNALRAAADGDADLAVRNAALKTLSGKH